jgi:hypothetical protein
MQFSDNFQLATVPQITKRYAVGDTVGSNNLIIKGSKISLLLLIIVMLPIIIEAGTLLNIWLVDVPPHAIIFTHLCLIASLCNALSGLLVYGALATGNVKKYQIVMSSIISLQFFSVWVLFSMGVQPEVMYITEMLCYIVALFARLTLLKGMIQFPVARYLNEVVLKCLLVFALSFIIPYYLHTIIDGWFVRIVCVFLSSILISIVLAYLLALTKNEKQMIRDAVISKFRFIKK